MKKIIILLLISCLAAGIFFVLNHFEAKSTSVRQPDYQPIAYINNADIHQLITQPRWQIKISQPNRPTSIYTQPELPLPVSENKTVLDYISFGQCPENQLAPDYLSQKMGNPVGKIHSGNENLPDCGLIRTKIPFSF